MSEGYHALASPSKAAMWIACPNSLAANEGQPDGDRKAADLGSDKHELLTLCMYSGRNAASEIGTVMKFGNIVTKEFAGDVQTVLDNVRARIDNYRRLGCVVTVELEQQLPISHITGEDGATGTGDIVLIVGWPDGHSTVDVIDAKFGYSEVLAEENPQLMMYGSGALEKFGLTEDFTEVTLVIEQPLRGSSEWTTTPNEIALWAELVAEPAAAKALLIHKMYKGSGYALKEPDFYPTEKGCMWCKAKAVCPALLKKVQDEMEVGFDSLAGADVAGMEMLSDEEVADKFQYLELIEDWANAVRARVEQALFAGKKLPGLKVVAGKKGNRQWSSDEEAEAMMKKFKLKQDQMYSMKLLGPKPILDLLKDQPRRMKQIEALVTQAQGKPHVALDTDPRPALEIKPVEDGFEFEDLV